MISPDTIDRVRDANDIVEVLGEYLPSIKRAGKDFKALCPFHQEKTPSFMISPSKGIFHCFGCGMGGDVFKFVMEMDRCTYPQAIRRLAEKKGIVIQEESQSGSGQKLERKKVLLSLLARAADFYHQSLLSSPEAQGARDYLQARGLSNQTIQEFKIGWAQGPQTLVNVALKSGFQAQDLKECGLARYSAKEGAYRDWFYGRIVFPIWDTKGQIIGFGGRVLDDSDKNVPKYLNSPENPVFLKGKNLYGFYQGAQSIRQKKSIVILEGYMDVIGCMQAGMRNVAAPLGTALTSEQCQLLKRYVENVVLLFDADRAGENAAWRGAELLLQFGFIPMIARLKDGKDPDEYLRQHSLQEFEEFLQQGSHFLEFCLDNFLEKNTHLPPAARKNAAVQTLMPLVLKIESGILRAEMIKFLSDRLQLPQEVMIAEFNKIQKKDFKRAAARADEPAQTTAQKVPRFLSLQEELLAQIVQDPSRLASLNAQEQDAIFKGAQAQDCLKAILAGAQNLQSLQSKIPPETLQWLSGVLMRQLVNQKSADEIFELLLKRLSGQLKQAQLKELSEKLSKGQASTEEAQLFKKLSAEIKGRNTSF